MVQPLPGVDLVNCMHHKLLQTYAQVLRLSVNRVLKHLMQQASNQIEIKIGLHPLQMLKKENTACSMCNRGINHQWHSFNKWTRVRFVVTGIQYSKSCKVKYQCKYKETGHPLWKRKKFNLLCIFTELCLCLCRTRIIRK